MSKIKDNVNVGAFVTPILHKRFCRCQAEMYDTEPTVFKCGDVETAVPDRSIPITELWSRFIRGENIVDQRMSKVSFNPIEDNPWKKKGLDLADVPGISQSIREMRQTAEEQALQEIAASKQANDLSKSQDVQQSQVVKPAAD